MAGGRASAHGDLLARLGVGLVSTFLINHFELFGLEQAFARLTGRNIAPAQFKTPLLYRYVRHPLYLGLLLSFWSAPVMSAGHLLFSAGASVYTLIGIGFEERDLVAQFGETYRRYRQNVGMLLPRGARTRAHVLVWVILACAMLLAGVSEAVERPLSRHGARTSGNSCTWWP